LVKKSRSASSFSRHRERDGENNGERRGDRAAPVTKSSEGSRE